MDAPSLWYIKTTSRILWKTSKKSTPQKSDMKQAFLPAKVETESADYKPRLKLPVLFNLRKNFQGSNKFVASPSIKVVNLELKFPVALFSKINTNAVSEFLVAIDI